MKIFFTFLTFFFLIVSQTTLADFPLRQSINWDGGSVIAYNSNDHEYLVVWSELIKMGSFYIIGPVMGQRVKETGDLEGSAFTIFSLGTLPSVAYNSQTNEYFVVSSYNGINGQRLTNTGTLSGSSIQLMTEGTWPRILYNPLSGDYLLSAANLVENPPSSGFYNIQIFTMRFDQFGFFQTPVYKVEDAPYGGNELGHSRFAIAYAPIQTPETPYGRYLLAVQTNSGLNLTMLDGYGRPIDVVYDPQSQQYFRYIPFSEGSVVGGEFNVDVTFGMKAGYNLLGPAFFVVWGDNNNTWDGQEWSGIYGSFVDPYKLNYLTTDPVQDNAFPISAIYDHYAFSTDEYAKSWKPKVAYNNAGQKFMVTWRETPTNNSQNDTKVNHIRADKEFTGGSYYTSNDVISAITGNENPKEPAIAASTINPTALITWNDYRNFSTTDWDLYANLYSVTSVPSIKVTKPNGGEDWFIDTEYEITWTSSNYSNPVRIEYSTDGGASFIEIVSSTTNDGSYLWTVPFTLSDFCVIRILDAADSDPFDISDAVFSITTTNKIVTNTNDSGLWSLRQAILDANSDPGYDTIIFKIPGAGIHTIQPLTELPTITDPVLIDGFSQPGSSPNTNSISQGCNAYLNIELDGTYAGTTANGLYIQAGNCVVRGLVINRFDSYGIKIQYYGNSIVEGNFIGTSVNGINDLGNLYGVNIDFSSGNLIGGTSPSNRNIISGNAVGILIEDPNATNNIIRGNYIGIDATGLNPLGQSENIIIHNSPGNYIGGTVEGASNIISGSGGGSISYDPPLAGIKLRGVNSTGNIIHGNYIGTNAAGNGMIPNHQAGIVLLSDGNTVGGSSVSESNVIAGNGSGIHIVGDYNLILGNKIGTLADGVSPMGNWEGIRIKGKNNTIGGTSLNDANVIAFNIKDGIFILSDVPSPGYEANENKILINSIFSNDRLGINLIAWNDNSSGITLNDVGDIDTGPNNLQNFPLLTSVENGIGTFITGSLNSLPNTTFRIDFYSSPVGDPSGYGEGQNHIGWTEVTTDANGDVGFYVSIGIIVPAGHVITATATDPDGNTSEFSNWIKTAAPTTYIVNNTNDSGTGSLRQAIIEANNNPGLDSIAFNILGTGPFTIQPSTELPAITDPVIIDGYTQPGSHPNTNSISEGSNAVLNIELDGSSISSYLGANGLYITSGNCTVRGLAINRFSRGITLSGVEGNGSNVIEGNYIGTNISGSSSLTNGVGIIVTGSSNNKIGGINPLARNIISGNATGVYIDSSLNNTIQGNYIGTDATGMLNLYNDYGINVVYSQSCIIGGSVDGLENVISGNTNWGLYLNKSSYNYIQKNYIGLDRTGKGKLGNGTTGIWINDSSNSNHVLSNKICDNGAIGIAVFQGSMYNFIGDNFIGTDEGWQFDLGNQGHGIEITGSSTNNNMLENNHIAYNGDCGVYIDEGKHNTLSRNLISKNVGKGIETIYGGNNELTLPIIITGSSNEVTGSTGSGYHVEIFSDDEDEGRHYLGSSVANSSGNFTFTLSEPASLPHVTATCTDAEGNTSEFSSPFVVTGIENEKNKIPTEYLLNQSYPNPFNPSTKISWQSPVNSRQVLKIFDVIGNEIATLVDEEMEAGYHSVEFSAGGGSAYGRNALSLPSGVYFYRLQVYPANSGAGNPESSSGQVFIDTKKMILLK